MNLLALIVVASLFCAGLMYLAGYLWGSRPRKLASSATSSSAQEAEIDRLSEALRVEQENRSADRVRIEQAFEAARERARAVEQQLGDAQRVRTETARLHQQTASERDQAQSERDRARNERDQALAECARARTERDYYQVERERAEAERDQAEAERDQAWANAERHRAESDARLSARVAEARRKTTAEVEAQWRSRLQDLEEAMRRDEAETQENRDEEQRLSEEHFQQRWADRIESLEQSLSRNSAELEAARTALAEMEELRNAAADRDALRLELEVSRRRLEEMDRLRSRLDAREAEIASHQDLRGALEEAQQEIEELRAQGLKRIDPPVTAPAPADGTPDDAVRSIAVRSGHRSTVVADDLGFPIVGYGEHQEHLAALCGVLVEVHERARGLLPLGRIHRVTLETDRGLTVSACSGEHEESTITLATLTAGPGLETPELREALSHFSSALDRGGHRSTEEM